MNIILLSGGSGKRLWPLSNDTRSKQFLKLLQAPDGNNESMVQRVYRQIKEAGINSNILIATGASQIDSIHNHLGNAVDVVLEPERRNTFPAIALSCAYLKYEKHCREDEVVVVLPVDPFADIAYFKTLLHMKKAVTDGTADLVLMGIEPTYPSAKYGYIVPEKNQTGEPKKVAYFTEKPTEEKAAQLISDGAVWNGGVFAFKLGWINRIIDSHIKVSSYKEMQSRYGELKKDSFDYEVVEKANSISMISYNGVWKDLGTWNTLTEQMEHCNIGSVITGEGTENTHIINELEIPLVVLGIKDVIITASPDGILVSDKQKSSYIKPYVDKLGERPMYEERRWGEYKIIDYETYPDGRKSLTKKLTIHAGKYTSYHTHTNRDEIWTFIDGTGELMIDGHKRSVKPGDTAYITAGTKHAIHAYSDLRLVEVQIGSELCENEKEFYKADW